MKDSGKDGDFGSRIPEALHMLPRGVTNSRGSEFLRETVENAERSVLGTVDHHQLSNTTGEVTPLEGVNWGEWKSRPAPDRDKPPKD
jgi:hypothetical protein